MRIELILAKSKSGNIFLLLNIRNIAFILNTRLHIRVYTEKFHRTGSSGCFFIIALEYPHSQGKSREIFKTLTSNIRIVDSGNPNMKILRILF